MGEVVWAELLSQSGHEKQCIILHHCFSCTHGPGAVMALRIRLAADTSACISTDGCSEAVLVAVRALDYHTEAHVLQFVGERE